MYCLYFLTQNIRKTYQYLEKQRIEQIKQLHTDEVGDAVAKAKKLSVETNKRRKYVCRLSYLWNIKIFKLSD